ncbi:hypothetical protein D3C85_1327850 [compost metagenome]
MAHKENPALRRSAALTGSQLALSSLTGARYHLATITRILDTVETGWRSASDRENRPPFAARQSDELHWHLRSFFWELVGVFDLMLQWSNEHFKLKLSEDRVSWKTVQDATSSIGHPSWPTVRQALRDAWDSEWYFDVRTYRNFSHRSFLRLQALVPTDPSERVLVAIDAARENAPMCADVRDELPRFVEAMRELGASVFSHE